MANPTFSSTALTSEAAHCRIGSRRPRAYVQTLPGVNGLFVQTHGHGGRDLIVAGLLTGSGATPAAARNSAMAAFRQREALADGLTIATCTGTDGADYDNCLLQSYTHGKVRISRVAAANYVAYLPVRAQLLQLTP